MSFRGTSQSTTAQTQNGISHWESALRDYCSDTDSTRFRMVFNMAVPSSEGLASLINLAKGPEGKSACGSIGAPGYLPGKEADLRGNLSSSAPFVAAVHEAQTARAGLAGSRG